MYIRRDRQPLELAAAYRPLGGVERFLTSWSSEVMFGAAAWTPGKSAIGTFMSPFPTWGADLNRAVARFEPEGGATGAHAHVVPRRCPVVGTGAGALPQRLVGFSSRCCDSTRPASSRWSPRLAGRLKPAWVRIAPDHDSPDKPRWSADGEDNLLRLEALGL